MAVGLTVWLVRTDVVCGTSHSELSIGDRLVIRDFVVALLSSRGVARMAL